MAFDAKYLICIGDAGGNGQRLWSYRDTAASTAIDAAGYLASRCGMQIGDLVFYTQVDDQATPTSVTAGGTHVCMAVSATTGYPDLSNVTAWTVTNSD